MNIRDNNEYLAIQAYVTECRTAGLIRLNGNHVVIAHPDGQRILFSVADPEDYIQKNHFNGQFFEPEELTAIADVFPADGVYVDIGANIGNHALYVAAVLNPGRIIPFEPNRAAIRLLIENIALNGLFDVFDLTHLGLGLSDAAASGFRLETPRADNLGMTQLVEGGGGVPLTTGDEALVGETRIDLIKMDVEGMEMQALNGLSATITRTRPRILIEVDHGNRAAFDLWLDSAGYQVETTFQRMRANQNFLIAPR